MKITLPTKKGNPNTNPEIEFDQIVIVGANGSGKTRFGSYIEEHNSSKTHRISAQKSLTMPNFVSTKSQQIAENEFLYGGWMDSSPDYYKTKGWKDSRWGGKLSTFLLNDYEKLMVLLHTEEFEESLNYKEKGGEKPNTKLDRIQKIWEEVLPHRKLKKRAGVIETYPTGNKEKSYNGSEMSDGERVIFYLIGEVVCVPQNSIIIFDEPEMHIHKSLIKKLFDLIENERSDCSFIYLTHDIDFAFSRQNASKIWTKNYEKNIWDYELLDNNMPIPEQLYLEVLGSRNPVLFIEGDGSSIDYELYQHVYLDFTLKPLGSCDKVISTVKAFNEQNGFHHIESNGIIDRDRRKEDDVVRLNNKNIWVLDVAEAENLLLIEEIVKAVANHMGENPTDIFIQVKQNLFTYFETQLENQILIHFQERIRREMIAASSFSRKEITSVIEEVDLAYEKINMQELYDETKNEFQSILDNSDYDGLLRVFNLKNALIPNSKVCTLTNINNKESYLKMVITLIKRYDENSNNLTHSINRKILKNAV